MYNWIVQCKQLHHPYSVVHRKIEAETPEQAMIKINEADDEYAAVSVRYDPFVNHVFDQRVASL